MSFLQRTVTCGFLRPEHSGNEVVLNGWIHRRRDFGSVTFWIFEIAMALPR